MTNSTETLEGSANETPLALETAGPGAKANRKAEVTPLRSQMPLSKSADSEKSSRASRRKGRPRAKRTKIKARLGILTKEQRHEAGKALREKCPVNHIAKLFLGRASAISSS
jgi:hypothetical protein